MPAKAFQANLVYEFITIISVTGSTRQRVQPLTLLLTVFVFLINYCL